MDCELLIVDGIVMTTDLAHIPTHNSIVSLSFPFKKSDLQSRLKTCATTPGASAQ